MKDQLALYRLDTGLFDKIPEMDFIEGGELSAWLERKGKHTAELMMSAKVAVGEILLALTTIMGVRFDGIVGRSGMAVGPTGPVTFCAHITDGELRTYIESLGQAQRCIGRQNDPDENVADKARRLDALAEQLGIGPKLKGLLREIEQFLGQGKGGRGELIAVYARWS
jgi:hypothetical protein